MDFTKIYCLERNNIPFYIGKTRSGDRLSAHKRKYGDDILLIVLDEIPTKEWKFWEKYYISLFKSWGFKLENKNNGGGGPTTFISTPERNNKLRKPRNWKRSLKGKKLKDSHKQKIKNTRDFLKGRKAIWFYKEINQYDLEGNFIKEWSSQMEASKFIGTKGDGIGACCRGRQKTAYGYIWKFKN